MLTASHRPSATRNKVRVLVVGAAAAALALSPVVGAHAEPPKPLQAPSTDVWIVNRADGGRLYLVNDGTGEGATVGTVRGTWNMKSDRWDVTAQTDGTWVLRNVLANKCLQPNVADAKDAKVGSGIVVKTCNGAAVQKWSPVVTDLGWLALRPAADNEISAAADTPGHGAKWSYTSLDWNVTSSDRLWHLFTPPGNP